MHHNPCFNLFIVYSNPFDNQGREINKNDIFLRFVILPIYNIYLYIYKIYRYKIYTFIYKIYKMYI